MSEEIQDRIAYRLGAIPGQTTDELELTADVDLQTGMLVAIDLAGGKLLKAGNGEEGPVLTLPHPVARGQVVVFDLRRQQDDN